MEGVKYLQLNDIDAYKRSYNLSNYIWDLVSQWDYFSKNSIGMQFVRAIDSVSANIAEGFGRYGKKEKIQFYRYSYGSIKESLDWTQKAKSRGLINLEQYNLIYSELICLPKLTRQLIKYTNLKLQQ